MKLLILGDAEVGKDAVAESISHQFSIPTMSSSAAAKELVFQRSKKLQEKYVDATAAWLDRRTPENRREWYFQICQINKHDPTTLARFILEKSDIYTGMRDPAEFHACQESKLFDLVIWVRSDVRGASESKETNKLTHEICDIEICNNFETLQELDERVFRVFSKIIHGTYLKRPLVYVAGPYTGNERANVDRAINTWMTLRSTELITPYIPHLTHYIDNRFPRDYEFWMDYCFDMLEKCDALFRMPGMSPGSDREVDRARELGIPVFREQEELIKHFQHRQ